MIPDRARGRLYVLSGPSGVGKSTVLVKVRDRRPDLWYSISATTRTPRPGEKDGQNYFFLTPAQFLAAVDAGQMLEHAFFAGHFYGTPRAAVLEHLAAGQDVLLEIEVSGARQVRASGELGREAILIFLAPPSFAELERRLVGRGTEAPGVQDARLAAARAELAAEAEFDHTVVNADVEAATRGLLDLLSKSQAQPPGLLS